MEIVTTDNQNLMTIERLEKQGNNLVVHGEIMGAMPVRAVLTPDQARAALSKSTDPSAMTGPPMYPRRNSKMTVASTLWR